MKRLGCLVFLLAGAFFSGTCYGVWAAQQQQLTVYMDLPKNAVRLKDGDHEWSQTVSEDGRIIIIVWRR